MKKHIWMTIAKAELGVRSFPSGGSNPRITEYHQNTNIEGYDDKAAWCSSFLNWVFEQAGYRGTGSALARSWLEWGTPLTSPRPGCVVVLERENPNGWQGRDPCNKTFSPNYCVKNVLKCSFTLSKLRFSVHFCLVLEQKYSNARVSVTSACS